MSLLKRVDLPTLGLPTMATEMVPGLSACPACGLARYHLARYHLPATTSPATTSPSRTSSGPARWRASPSSVQPSGRPHAVLALWREDLDQGVEEVTGPAAMESGDGPGLREPQAHKVPDVELPGRACRPC